ncbi:MAG TPA: hypothetical protein VJ227_01775 [Patescibacteria group bacterium]|nr:hypothetical protein [Patescibacteria group bacterium]
MSGGAQGSSNINRYFLSPFSELSSVGDFVSLFVNIAFVVAGLIILFFFIVGGIGIISSAGESDPQKMEQAKKTLTSAVIGFIVVFTSYWIVKLIGSLIGMPELI